MTFFPPVPSRLPAFVTLPAYLDDSWPAPSERRPGRGSFVTVVVIYPSETYSWPGIAIDQWGHLMGLDLGSVRFDVPK